MRTPTPLDVQLAWWRRATETGADARQGDEPECGWFKQREAPRSRIWIPARVWLHQEIDWETGELTEPESYVLEIGNRTWTDQMIVAERAIFLRPVTMQEWKWLTARHALRSGSPATAYISDWREHNLM